MRKQDAKNLKAFAVLERLSKSCNLMIDYDEDYGEDFADYLLRCCSELEATLVQNDDGDEG